jgi:hypothetical protein
MAHWAELNEDNVVIRVIVGDNNDPNGDEGYRWIMENLGGRWVKTSYNNNFRGVFAGVGYTYDEELDRFIEPGQYPPEGGEPHIFDEQLEEYVPIE